MFFCPDCHVSNRTDAKFCRKCGKSRAELERTGTRDEAVLSQVESGRVEDATKQIAEEVSALESVEADEWKSVSAPESATEPVNATPSSAPETTVEPKKAAAQALVMNSVAQPGADSLVSEPPSEDSGTPSLSVQLEEGEVSLSAPPEISGPECPNCWKALRATDKFCCWCGEAQPNRVLPFLKLCLECSTFLPEKANFCYSCGTDVGYSSRRKVKVPHELFKDEDSEFFPRFNA